MVRLSFHILVGTILALSGAPLLDPPPAPEPVFWEVWTSQEPWEWWRLAEEEPEELPQEEHVPEQR